MEVDRIKKHIKFLLEALDRKPFIKRTQIFNLKLHIE